MSTSAKVAVVSGFVLFFACMNMIAFKISSTDSADESADLTLIIGELRHQHDILEAEVRETQEHAADLSLILSIDDLPSDNEAEVRRQLTKSQSAEFRKLVQRRDELAKLLADYESRFFAGLE